MNSPYNKFTVNLDLNPDSDHFFFKLICMVVLQILDCRLYNRSKHTELLLVTANKQHVQQFYQLDLNPDRKLNFLEEKSNISTGRYNLSKSTKKVTIGS